MKNILVLLLILSQSAMAQPRYSIVIDEIMADPSPVVSLPSSEWIELRNTSNAPINLQNWRIGDASNQSGPMPLFILEPDSLLIVCSATTLPLLSVYGNAVSVTGFPSLDNDGDLLFIKSSTGMIIHAVNYSSAWYNNVLKKEGGWTLEMIDTNNPCTGSDNWNASVSLIGGTPGKVNSVNAITVDNTASELVNAFTNNNTTVVIEYDEPVDSLSGATTTNYSIDGGLTVSNAITLPPLFTQVQLTLNNPMIAGNIYTISANHVKDCLSNEINTIDTIKTGLPAEASTRDLIINEVLFNPRPNAFDYIECYNNSQKIIDAAKLSIANRNSNNVISTIRSLSTVPHYIFPGDYIVITENADNLGLNYLVKFPGNVLSPATLPSFPDQQGDVVLLNAQGEIIDEVAYDEDWHFKLLNNKEGVSLERIDPNGNSNDPQNWHSAASTAGYGTPTYKNSQYKNLSGISASIDIRPTVFSPDNDGRDDVATIQYKTEAPGYVANVIIFDITGRSVRYLIHNALLGNTGYWNWDGLGDRGQQLSVGPYIILTEIFNLQGKKDHFRNTIVLARKFK
ncbi:MAG: lamin tail domain-containing protein [Chitinophagaceae bacterium]